MKPLIVCALPLLGATLLGTAPLIAAEPSPACVAKRTEIERSLSEATARANTREVRGLRKALRANQDNCTTASLEAERNRDIAEATQDVADREAELAKAEHKGDASKVAKQREKLDEARRDLAEAQRPLPQ